MKWLLYAACFFVLGAYAIGNKWYVDAMYEYGCWMGVIATHDTYQRTHTFKQIVYTQTCKPE